MNTNSIAALLSAVLHSRYEVEVAAVANDRATVRLSRPENGQPAIVLDAEAWNPDTAISQSPAPYHLWVVDSTRRAVAEPLRARRQSFIDLRHATVFLDLPEILIDRTATTAHQPDIPRAAAHTDALTRQLIDPFADRASLISRVLLESPYDTTWTVTGLAEAAGVAPMLSSHIVRQLAANGTVRATKVGRKLLLQLIQPRRLLDAWTARYDWRRNTALAVAAPVGDDERYLRRFAALMPKKTRWALTLLAGAWRRTKYTPADRLHVYVEVAKDSDLKALARELGWVPDPAGPLVLLRPAYRTSVWHGMQMATQVPTVSDLQLVVDLWHYPVRGRETALQIFDRMEQRLGHHTRPHTRTRARMS